MRNRRHPGTCTLVLFVLALSLGTSRPSHALELMTVLEFVGPRLWKAVGPKLVDEIFGPEDAKAWKARIGLDNPEEEIKAELVKVKQDIADVKRVLDDVNTRTMFTQYDNASLHLASMEKTFLHASSDAARRNAAKRLLHRETGAMEQLRLMMDALLHKTGNINKSVLEQYSDVLIQRRIEVFAYLQSVDAVVHAVEFKALETALLRAKALEVIYGESEALKEQSKDVGEFAGQAKQISAEHERLTKRARKIVRQLDEAVLARALIRLRHRESGNFLTIFPGGNSESNIFFPTGGPVTPGTAEVYVYGPAVRQVETVHFPSDTRIQPKTIRMEPAWQLWRISRHQDPKTGSVSFRFLTKSSEYYLGQSQDNKRACLVSNPVDWYVIADKGGYDTEEEFPPLLLSHNASGQALDSNADTAAVDRATSYDNKYMKWSILPEHLPMWPEKIDVTTDDNTGKIYLFSFATGRYLRFDKKRLSFDPPYPLSMAQGFPGLWPSFDTAFGWKSDYIYFFRGDLCLRWNIKTQQMDFRETPISRLWPLLNKKLFQGIRAAFGAANGYTYFFAPWRHNTYVRWHNEKNEFAGMAAVSEGWPGVLEHYFDTVFAYKGDAWFVKNGTITRYDMNNDHLEGESFTIPEPPFKSKEAYEKR